jgi:hypothetical protein
MLGTKQTKTFFGQKKMFAQLFSPLRRPFWTIIGFLEAFLLAF